MWSGNPPTGRPGGSFIEAARRAQVVAAAIQTVNEVGYHRSSLAQIASRAGIAKSVISYHFDGKEELLLHVVEQVFTRLDAATRAAAEAPGTAGERLAAYAHAYLAFVQDNRDAAVAAVEIAVSHRGPDGVPLYLTESVEDRRLLEGLIADGIASGEFREVDLLVATTTVLHALDGALTRAQMDAGTDLVAYGEHLVPMLLAALGRGRGG